jgi:hypothetical protein
MTPAITAGASVPMEEDHPAQQEEFTPWIPIINKYEILWKYANKVCEGSAEDRNGRMWSAWRDATEDSQDFRFHDGGKQACCAPFGS